MKLYIAGPMTGHENLNFPAFNAVAQTLRGTGHEVANPAEINPDQDTPWAVCMLHDLAELVTCQGVVMLAGWEASPGACIEQMFAKRMGLHIFSATSLDDVPHAESLEQADTL